MLTQAGPEIGVASTKAFTTQLVSLVMLALMLRRVRGLSTPRRKYRRIRAPLHPACGHLAPLRYSKGTSAVAKHQQAGASAPSIRAGICAGEH